MSFALFAAAAGGWCAGGRGGADGQEQRVHVDREQRQLPRAGPVAADPPLVVTPAWQQQRWAAAPAGTAAGAAGFSSSDAGGSGWDRKRDGGRKEVVAAVTAHAERASRGGGAVTTVRPVSANEFPRILQLYEQPALASPGRNAFMLAPRPITADNVTLVASSPADRLAAASAPSQVCSRLWTEVLSLRPPAACVISSAQQQHLLPSQSSRRSSHLPAVAAPRGQRLIISRHQADGPAACQRCSFRRKQQQQHASSSRPSASRLLRRSLCRLPRVHLAHSEWCARLAGCAACAGGNCEHHGRTAPPCRPVARALPNLAGCLEAGAGCAGAWAGLITDLPVPHGSSAAPAPNAGLRAPCPPAGGPDAAGSNCDPSGLCRGAPIILLLAA